MYIVHWGGLGPPKRSWAASGRLKILYDYIYTKINSWHPDSAWQQLIITLQFYEDFFGRFSVKKRQFLGGLRPPHNL